MPRLTIPVTVAATCLLAAGCQSPPVRTWQPRLVLDDLSAGLPETVDAYRLLTEQPTQGRFGCGLAIARVEYLEQADPRLALVDTDPAEQAWWWQALMGIPEIRDVAFLSPASDRDRRDDAADYCAAALRVGAPLLLVYAPNRFGPNSAQVLGLLYDTERAQPIATLHAGARFLNDENEEVSPDEEKGDQRDWDAGYQASRSFELHARACLLALMRLDSPPPTTQPHEWDTPWPQRWWIPHVIHFR